MRWIIIEENEKRHRYAVAHTSEGIWVGWPGQARLYKVKQRSLASEYEAENANPNSIRAPLQGKVTQVKIKMGAEVKEGETLVLLEAMKMEYPLVSPKNGKVKSVLCQAGELVSSSQLLLELE